MKKQHKMILGVGVIAGLVYLWKRGQKPATVQPAIKTAAAPQLVAPNATLEGTVFDGHVFSSGRNGSLS